MGLVARHWGALLIFGGAALTPILVRDAYFLDSLVLILLWGALSAAWNVAGGYAGQVSIGHAAFFGIGAYSAALLGTRFQQSPWLGMLVGVALSLAAGAAIGYLSNRLKGPYFALSTIAFSQVLLIVASRWRAFTSGSEGIPVPFRPGFATLGLGHVAWVYLALVVALLYWGLELWLEHSRFGARLVAVRENEEAAQALGIDVFRVKLGAITLSAALAAMAGIFYAQLFLYLDPGIAFGPTMSVEALLVPIIGGMGTMLGPLLGAIVLQGLGELAMTVLGPRGVAACPGDQEVERWRRLFLFSRADTIYGGSNEIQRGILAERVLGLPRQDRR